MKKETLSGSGMARIRDLEQVNTSSDKKKVKKEKKKEKKEQKQAEKKGKYFREDTGTKHIKGDTDLSTAKNVSSFSKGHSTYSLKLNKGIKQGIKNG